MKTPYQPPFSVGDKVVIKGNYFWGKRAVFNTVVRTVTRVTTSKTAASGWEVDTDGPPRNGLKGFDSGWFQRITPSHSLLGKIKDQILSGKTNQEINQSFQRHVTKEQLIQCIRELQCPFT
jgi:hypothetical protein